MNNTKGGINYPKMKFIPYLKTLYWIRYKSGFFNSWFNFFKHYYELDPVNQESSFYYGYINYTNERLK